MRALRRKAWPLFVLAFVLGVTGILIGGVVGGLIAAACIAFFILGSLRKLGQTAHDLPGTERITGTWVTDLDKHKRMPPNEAAERPSRDGPGVSRGAAGAAGTGARLGSRTGHRSGPAAVNDGVHRSSGLGRGWVPTPVKADLRGYGPDMSASSSDPRPPHPGPEPAPDPQPPFPSPGPDPVPPDPTPGPI